MSELLDSLFTEHRGPGLRRGEGLAAHQDIAAHGYQGKDKEISTKWMAVCSLELQGFSREEIARRVGVAVTTVSNITTDQRYRDYRDARLAALYDEFFSMKPLALEALKGGLKSNDENTALRASEQWFKAASFGGYSKTETPTTTLTAEDVARQLLGVQVNVTVNVPSSDEPQREALYSRPDDSTDERVE